MNKREIVDLSRTLESLDNAVSQLHKAMSTTPDMDMVKAIGGVAGAAIHIRQAHDAAMSKELRAHERTEAMKLLHKLIFDGVTHASYDMEEKIRPEECERIAMAVYEEMFHGGIEFRCAEGAITKENSKEKKEEAATKE